MDAVEMVAQMMAVAAITAPKTRGENFVQVKIIQGEALAELARGMLAFGERAKDMRFGSAVCSESAPGCLQPRAVLPPGAFRLFSPWANWPCGWGSKGINWIGSPTNDLSNEHCLPARCDTTDTIGSPNGSAVPRDLLRRPNGD